jgi:hypothetical protein
LSLFLGICEYVAYECAKQGASQIILSARSIDLLNTVGRNCERLAAERKFNCKVSIIPFDFFKVEKHEEIVSEVFFPHLSFFFLISIGDPEMRENRYLGE